MVKNLPPMPETWVQSLGQEDPLEKGMATSILGTSLVAHTVILFYLYRICTIFYFPVWLTRKKKFLQTEFSSVRYFLMKFCEHVLFLFCKDEKSKKGGPFSLDLTEL